LHAGIGVRVASMLRRAGLVLIAGLLAGTADAQEDPVTFYGSVYPQLESVEVLGDGAFGSRRMRVTDQSSRLGVRGSENLGGGNFAWFQLEAGFPVDQPLQLPPPMTFDTRNSGVGLQGPWGSFIVGRWDSAFYQSQTSVDPFNDVGLPGISGAAVNQGNFARRDFNTVQYWSPRVPGWRTRINAGTREVTAPNGARPGSYGAMISHVGDTSYVAIAFERHMDQAFRAVVPGKHEEGRGIAGRQRFGRLRASAQYGSYKATGAITQRSYMLALEWLDGPHEFLATFQVSHDGGPVSAPAQPRCNLVGAGYRYRFSQRSYLMAQYAHVNNKVGSLCNFASNHVTITGNQDLRGVAIGMRTNF
jgi:predicted porin